MLAAAAMAPNRSDERTQKKKKGCQMSTFMFYVSQKSK
jgi:hypothetical protein